MLSCFLLQIGDKDAAIEAVRLTNEKTVSSEIFLFFSTFFGTQVGLGNRMDLVFLNIRVGLFHNDHAITTANIAKAKQMLEEGGDWDRRNRLKVGWCECPYISDGLDILWILV